MNHTALIAGWLPVTNAATSVVVAVRHFRRQPVNRDMMRPWSSETPINSAGLFPGLFFDTPPF